MEIANLILFVQAAYYLLTGLWPLIDADSFQAVTGPKTDVWLVKTVGVLVTAIGASLAAGARQRPVPGAITLLAVTAASGLAAVEIAYAWLGVISRLYLLDAALEIFFATSALVAARRS